MNIFPVDPALLEDEAIMGANNDGPELERVSEDRSPSPPLLMHRKITRKEKPATPRQHRPATRAQAGGRRPTRLSEKHSIDFDRPVQAHNDNRNHEPPIAGFNFFDNEDDSMVDFDAAMEYARGLCDDLEARADHPFRDQIPPNAPVPPPGYVIIRHNPRIARPLASMRSVEDEYPNAPPPPNPDQLLDPIATIYTTLTSSNPSLLGTPLPYTPTISAYPPTSYKGPITWNRVWKHISIKSTASKAQMVDFLSRCGVPKEVYETPGVKNRDLYPYITRHQQLNKEAKDKLEGN